MCLYLSQISNCIHPECIFITNVKTNFQSDFKQQPKLLQDKKQKKDALKQLNLKQDRSKLTNKNENVSKSQEKNQYFFVNQRFSTQKVKNPVERPEHIAKNSLSNPVQQIIDNQIKVLLNKNVEDFIIQLSQRYTQNLKAENTKNQQKIIALKRKIQEMKRMKFQ